MKILEYPNETLRKVSEKVADPTSVKTKQLILNMTKTLRSNNGLGLAAPQVGENLQICVIEIENELFVLINPEIKSLSKEKIPSQEGCLSFPNKYLDLERHKRVKVKATDTNGKKQMIRARGLLARVIQHEIDHLNGVLIVDRVNEKEEE